MRRWMIVVARWRMVLILALLLAAVSAAKGDAFLKFENLVNIPRQISFEAIIAFGMTLVIITGGIDLSVGSLVALSGVLAGLAMRGLADAPLGLALAAGVGAAVAAGAACGAFSGFVITRFAVPPFIVTLSMMLGARGAAFMLCGGRPVYELPEGIRFLGRGFVGQSWFGPLLPVPVLVMLLVCAAFHLLLTRSVFGRQIVAVGSNAQASYFSGVNVRRTRLLVYVILGALCGGVGLLSSARLMSADPKSGEMWELNVIAAVVVGGTSLFGGHGSVGGTLVGALIIGVLNNALNLLNVGDFMQRVVVGAVILAAALLDSALRRLEVGRQALPQ